MQRWMITTNKEKSVLFRIINVKRKKKKVNIEENEEDLKRNSRK